MPDSLSELKRKNLQKRLTALHKEYQAANTQLTRTLSDIERIRIRRQIQDLEQQIQQAESPAPTTKGGV